jgi:hypothetical protein
LLLFVGQHVDGVAVSALRRVVLIGGIDVDAAITTRKVWLPCAGLCNISIGIDT